MIQSRRTLLLPIGTQMGAICFLTCMLFRAVSAGDLHKTILDRKIEAFSAPWGLEFENLCRNLEIPCGVQIAKGDAELLRHDGSKPALETKSGHAVREILGTIVKRHPRYRWIFDDGVINLIPRKKEMRLVRGQDPLKKTVAVMDLAQIDSLAAMAKTCLTAGIVFGTKEHSGPKAVYGTVDVHVGHTALRHALNAIALADGKVMWTLEFDDAGAGYLESFSWRPSPLR